MPAARDGAVQRLTKAEIFVTIEGYRGPLIAIYDQPGGIAPAWRGDTALYAVPPSGIVRIALAEPARGTRVFLVESGVAYRPVAIFGTCDEEPLVATADLPQACWLDFEVGGTGIPDHIVAVVTSALSLDADYYRTTFVYDSVVLGGNGGKARNRQGRVRHSRPRS